MSLKQELQELEEETVVAVNNSLQERLDSIAPEDLAAEALASIVSYPALNKLVKLVLEQALNEGLPIDEVIQRATGASHALLTLTTIAELQVLPPI